MLEDLPSFTQGGVLVVISGIIFMVFKCVITPLMEQRKHSVNGRTSQLDKIESGVEVLNKQHNVFWSGTQTPVWHNPPELLAIMESIKLFLVKQDKHLQNQQENVKEFTGSFQTMQIETITVLSKIDATLSKQTSVLENLRKQ